MSKIEERLLQNKKDLERQTQYKAGLPGSALDIVNTLLEDLEEDKKENGWIPVEKRLPKEDVLVLVWFEYFRYGNYNKMYSTYGFGYVVGGKFSNMINGASGWRNLNVIAWKPLPEPYKEN